MRDHCLLQQRQQRKKVNENSKHDTINSTQITLHLLTPLLMYCLSTTYFKEVCHDSDDGKKDKYGDNCTSWYNKKPEYCGRFDDNDFSADSMCCACKGKLF